MFHNLQPRGLLTLSFVILCFIMPLFTGGAQPLFFGGLILTVSLSYYFSIKKQIEHLEVERKSIKSAFEGQTVLVRIRITNNSMLPVLKMKATDHFGPDFQTEKHLVLKKHLPAKASVAFSYHGHCFYDRGYYDLGPVQLALSDPLGMFEIKYDVNQMETFSVYAEIFDLDLVEFHGFSRLKNRALSNMDAGESQQNLGVREYSPGDPIRFLHWAQTAKRNELMVRSFEKETGPTVLIILDLQLNGRAGTGKESIEEYAVQSAGSIASLALKGGHATGVLINAERELYIPPSVGQPQNTAILETLIEVRQKSEKQLHHVLDQYYQRFPENAHTFLILSITKFDKTQVKTCMNLLIEINASVSIILVNDEDLIPYHDMPANRKTEEELPHLVNFLSDSGAERIYIVDHQHGVKNSFNESYHSTENLPISKSN